MPPSDTKPQMQQVYDQLWQKLSLEDRFLKGLEWIQFNRELLLAGLRSRHPNLSEEEIRQKLLQDLYPNNS